MMAKGQSLLMRISISWEGAALDCIAAREE